jgi:hypothetical protein
MASGRRWWRRWWWRRERPFGRWVVSRWSKRLVEQECLVFFA